METALNHAWPMFDRPIHPRQADDWIGMMVGRKVPRQTGQGRTLPGRDGSRVIFAPASDAALWWQHINENERLGQPLASACFAYAQTVLSHPYLDGNGRLARFVYTRSLARNGLLHGPFLPLGPLVYVNHRVHNSALQHLGTTGDWGPFVNVMLGLTRKAAAFTVHSLSDKQSVA